MGGLFRARQDHRLSLRVTKYFVPCIELQRGMVWMGHAAASIGSAVRRLAEPLHAMRFALASHQLPVVFKRPLIGVEVRTRHEEPFALPDVRRGAALAAPLALDLLVRLFAVHGLGLERLPWLRSTS